jgi:hypothetical protein
LLGETTVVKELNWHLRDDRKTVTLTFPANPPFDLNLDTAGVETILESLGKIRAAMVPGFARTFGFGQKVEVIENPSYATELELMHGHSLIHLRDPRFGWLHYVLPKPEAGKLANVLLKQVAAPPPGQTARRPN